LVLQRLLQPLLLFPRRPLPCRLLPRTDILALFPLHLLDVLARHLQVPLQCRWKLLSAALAFTLVPSGITGPKSTRSA
jgi:hypothetical protein